MKKYIYALDLALNYTGVCIFSDDGSLIYKTTIETNKEKDTPRKLKLIGDSFLKLIKEYKPSVVVIEEGFSRFNRSTQQLFKCHGVVSYIFWEYPQVYIPASTVKKTIGGKGNIKKEELQKIIKWEYPEIEFNSMDESDAFALGQTYFIEQRSYNGKKNGTQ